jgi:hypothetical protein
VPRFDLRPQRTADQCPGRVSFAPGEGLAGQGTWERSIFKDDDIEQDDLRSPHTPWAVLPPRPVEPVAGSFRCEALIIGAGITGPLVAERLTRQGRQVVIIDRELPSLGSTVASTAMLLWEIDRPLFELAQLYGFEKAVRCYRATTMPRKASCPWLRIRELRARCVRVSRSISLSMTVRSLFRMNTR